MKLNITKSISILVLVLLIFANLGFNIQLVSAYDPWGQVQKWQNWNPNGFGGPGAPMSGPGFQSYGYQYFNPWAGPSIPQGRGSMVGSLSFYDYTAGYPGGGRGGGGWDGYAYGTYQPGCYGLYGLYGYGRPNPFRN